MPRKSTRYRAIPAYYDAEYESNEVLDHDVPFMLRHLPRRRRKVLELCCGTARAAIPVAQSGHRVVGVDYDPRLLTIATRKRESSGIKASDLSFVCQDVLNLELNDRFDFAFLLFNTFLTFTTGPEQDRLISRVARHLKPGGRFWIDIFYPDLTLLAEPHHPCCDSATFYVHELDRSVHRTTEIRRSRKDPQVQEMTFHYTWADATGQLHHQRVEFELTWMFPRELERILATHGFEVEQMYGDYTGAPVDPDSSRIIVLARRR